MPLSIDTKKAKVSGEDLAQIYKIFCKAFDIEVEERDIKFMRSQGLRDLLSWQGLDYRPFMGAKFIGYGQRNGTVILHGYNDPEDQDWERKDNEFAREANKYLEGRIK